AARTPDAVALAFESGELSYRELDRQADGLAAYLKRRLDPTDGSQAVVGVALGRSPQWIVALLAVMKAGAVYLPLDPDYPADRLSFMLGDSGCSLVLTSSLWQDSIPSVPGGPERLNLDDAEGPWTSEPSAGRTAVDPDLLAYLIYTSGSTGRPKGVPIRHRGFLPMIQAQGRIFHLDASSRVLQFSSPNFDASLMEIFMALSQGGSLHLMPDERLFPGAELADFCRRRRISHSILTPATLAAMPEGSLETLTTLITGGEACSRELAARWAPGRRFFNAYGPTEASICATLSRPLEADLEEAPPIGRPIGGIRCFVVDRGMELVPLGVAGELVLAGGALSPGYWHRPSLTAERFVPDPLSGEPGSRVYRTGDRVTWKEDGSLRFFGRVDHQVKVRGFRIELGEVESRLLEHPSVAEACAVVEQTATGAQLLAALSPEGTPPTSDELRAALARTLPEHMIPSAFIVLERLPQNASGKV
ncbi:MAG: amino acid adenylation domain-containing protein, partial [Acidobacteria bacterium]|nr:amino acid adenylation domain-containing protein [Acidobacteriota bacterium]